MDAIEHTASPFHFNVTDAYKDLVDPARNGTLSVLKSAQKNGNKVKRIVITSSFASVVNTSIPPVHTFTEKDWNTFSPAEVREQLGELNLPRVMPVQAGGRGRELTRGTFISIHLCMIQLEKQGKNCDGMNAYRASKVRLQGDNGARIRALQNTLMLMSMCHPLLPPTMQTLAERAAWEFVEKEKPQWDLVTLCPPFVLGPILHQVSRGQDRPDDASPAQHRS